ncbi:MAG TPA: Uma2 family endonuclease [Thermoanaerobaculia bacterium]|jgi:Uma2 family endonuclease|nr:Uma2 family endonuclease [Thermoanaerobaculia bacterium]
MSEPTRRALQREGGPAASESREEIGRAMLLRWVERPDGRRELIEIPLTREDYLNPQLGDKWVQGRKHGEAIFDLGGRLGYWFHSSPDFLVLFDVQHLLGPGLPKPCPDVSVIRGARNPDRVDGSYSVVKQGVPPCLIIEVISPRDPRIREIDEQDKVEIYQRAGVREYLLLELPRKPADRLGIFGYRLDPAGKYQRMVPDEQGRLLSETTGLWFSIPPEGERVVIRDVATGELVPTFLQEGQGRKCAEDKAAREAEARLAAEAKAATEAEARQVAEAKAAGAEAELIRLRTEMERLRGGR